MASLGEDPDSKFKVWFLRNAYGFCNIVQFKNPEKKNPKSNHSSQGLSILRFLLEGPVSLLTQNTVFGLTSVWIHPLGPDDF